MKRAPEPRPDIFDLYWRFAHERLEIFYRRVQGMPGPWTEDPTLQKFKFCNVYRAADRVSQYLIGRVAYHSEPCSDVDRIFQILAFRTFSRIETWEGLRAKLRRSPIIEDVKTGALRFALDAVQRENGGLYTGAFILCATRAYGYQQKHLNHVALFDDMFVRNDLGGDLLGAGSLEEIYQKLHAYPLMGDFMSYQIAVDLNYSDLFRFSENEFTRPGPGALRGIKKVLVSLGDYTPEEAILWMVEQQDRAFAERGLNFRGLWGRPLHAIDCQGLFCEVDKYCRVVRPELRSARKRMKSVFSPCPDSIGLFFPPRWDLNHRIPHHRVMGHRRAGPGRQRAFEFSAST